jgi:hypothetical protein
MRPQPGPESRPRRLRFVGHRFLHQIAGLGAFCFSWPAGADIAITRLYAACRLAPAIVFDRRLGPNFCLGFSGWRHIADDQLIFARCCLFVLAHLVRFFPSPGSTLTIAKPAKPTIAVKLGSTHVHCRSAGPKLRGSNSPNGTISGPCSPSRITVMSRDFGLNSLSTWRQPPHGVTLAT